MTGNTPATSRMVVLLAATALLLPAAGAHAYDAEPGSGGTLALGLSGATFWGDPLLGGYAAGRLPSEGPWAVGADAMIDRGGNERYYSALLALERNLFDLLSTPDQLLVFAGLRAGVTVEHDDPGGTDRLEPYPSAGLFAGAAWYFSSSMAVEGRLSIDGGPGPRVGLGVGVRLGR